jgi:hypothetical protein
LLVFCLFVHFSTLISLDFVVVVVSFVIVGFLFLFLSLLSFLLFLYYQLYHHHPLIPILTPFTLHPSPVLKPLVPCPTTNSAPSHLFSSPNPHLPLPFFPNLLPDYPSLLHTNHPLTKLLYQLYQHQIPAIPNTNTLFNNRNIPKT